MSSSNAVATVGENPLLGPCPTADEIADLRKDVLEDALAERDLSRDNAEAFCDLSTGHQWCGRHDHWRRAVTLGLYTIGAGTFRCLGSPSACAARAADARDFHHLYLAGYHQPEVGELIAVGAEVSRANRIASVSRERRP